MEQEETTPAVEPEETVPSPQPEEPVSTVTKKKSIVLPMIVIVLGCLAGVFLLLISYGKPSEPSYAFLKGATIFKVDEGTDDNTGFSGITWIYRLEGKYEDMVRTVQKELEGKNEGWAPSASEKGDGKELGLDSKAEPQSRDRYQVFTNESNGVEVVETEPVMWTYGDRQLGWSSPRLPNDEKVISILVTKSKTAGWFNGLGESLRQKLKMKALPPQDP